MNKIILFLILFISNVIAITYEERRQQLQEGRLRLISKNRSPRLNRYETYADAILMSFQVPDNTIFVSFKFIASELDVSIFGCKIRNVSLYMKHGAPPVINPDGSPFPEVFRNISRSNVYNLEFLTNTKEAYINITSPDPGVYYAATFLAYEDPRFRKIAQQGLSQSCNAYVDAAVYVQQIYTPTVISEHAIIDANLYSNFSRYFMFLVPDGVDHVIINLDRVSSCNPTKEILLRVQANRPPTKESNLVEAIIDGKNDTWQILFWPEPAKRHYVEVKFLTNTSCTHPTEVYFQLNFFPSPLLKAATAVPANNNTKHNISVVKHYKTFKLTDIQSYNEYHLVRENTAESFQFSYKLQHELDHDIPLPINVTSNEFSVLKFNLQKGSDVGGTLQYILAFKPRITKVGTKLIQEEEPNGHLIIGCIQKDSIAVPTWPRYCISNDVTMLSPLVLNKTLNNSTVLVPYPESGIWYASFKLFCGTCKECQCPDSCQKDYEKCTVECEMNCTNTPTIRCPADKENNRYCINYCSTMILKQKGCTSCNCDGPCLRNSSNSCNSSVIFDVSSRPCYYGDCGMQGKCALMISEGTAYSTCLCTNNYRGILRGFDCSDGSHATPYYLVLIEYLLLTLSNIFFLPVTYIGYKRQYYVESVSYFSIFLSSTFYHACDAGQNILSFCIFRLSALQFADFFSALLAIWLTLLAIADLPTVNLSILQMAGSILIAFSVTLNRYALWIFALPTFVGIGIICFNWFMKYKKYKQRFMQKRYLYFRMPTGIVLVATGLAIYGLLQRQDNYKYLHSLWHVIMAAGVYFLLPERETFQVGALL